MKNLFPFQVNNAKALHKMFSENKRLLLADETGLGKTYSTVLLIAMLALDKRQNKPSGKKEKTWKSHFNVLYICSNERIARKNMDELCKELCEKDLPAQAHELLDTQDTYNLDPLMAESDRKTMSTRRNARLSIPMETYETSYINLYNTTPETSFRKGNSATVGGTREERAALKTARKDCQKTECTECDCFAECRKNVSISNFNSKQFDLIILDEFQSFEDILSNAWENNTDKIILYLDELLSNNNNNNCKLLMLSATPYQTKASDLDSLRDFKRILSFLNPKLSQPFNYYCQQLNDPNAKLSVLETAKKAFEELFQQVCRRNQRSDVDIDQDLHSHIYGEQRGIEGLFEEFVACQDVFSKDEEFNAQGQKINIPKLIPAMCQNTPWPASFSKGCKLRESLDDLDYDDNLYFQIDNAARFLPSNDTGLQCDRILDPRSLKVPPIWPNWKGEQVRRIALGDKTYQNLLKCIWLPPSNPDHEPDKQSPYAPFYKNPPSKTIVFCEYMMTTRAIAAALSIEAVSGAGCFDLPEEEWQSLCLAPEQPTNGHPYCCALDALKRVAINGKNSDTPLDVAAVKAAQELVAYLRRDEIRAVLQKAGVTDKKSLLQYCHDGNLTAVLEEYWSERKPKLPTSELFYALYDAINADPEFQKKNFGRENQRKNFETAMEYIWKNRENEIGGLKSHLEAARQTEVAFSALLGKTCDFKCSGSGWKESKPWYLPSDASCGYSSEPNTYAEHIYAKYGNPPNPKYQAKCLLPEDAGNISIDTLVNDQIRVCAEILENGKTELSFQEKYYFCSNASSLQLKEKKKFECGRTGIWEGKPLVLGSQGLFSSVVLDLWDACAPCSDLLPTLPKSHVCIDSQNIQCAPNECEDNRGGHCARIPLGFACRYNEAVQDTRDHNENGAEQIAASFNSPFYPFVLLTSDVAKEGLSFHLYCRKLIHLRQTQRPAELIQRNGRVDRYHSLALRQRLAKNAPSCSDWEEKWKWARDEAQKNAYTGMQPDWHLPAQNGDPKIEIYYLDHPATFEVMKSVAMQSAAQWYTQVLGSLLPDSLLEKLRNRYGACLESDLINAVKLNLCPNPDDLLKISQTQSSSNQ